jgi:replicative DNA helicase
MGKTSLALDIARNAAHNGIGVGIFSLEMSRDQLVDRILASEADIDMWKMRTGRLSEEGPDNDFTRIQHAMGRLAEIPIFIDDTASANVMEVRTKARRLQAEHDLGLIVLDYLQLMQGTSGTDNRVQEVSEISRSLKALARELNVPVLALSQLSRAPEQRNPPIPMLSDLRESGSLEQDADVVMFIYREDYYKGAESRKPNIAEVLVKKHRNGPTGDVDLFFDAEKVTFRSIEKNQLQEPPSVSEVITPF